MAQPHHERGLIITAGVSLALLGTGALVSQMTEDTKEIYLDRVEVMVQLDEETSAADEDCSTEHAWRCAPRWKSRTASIP